MQKPYDECSKKKWELEHQERLFYFYPREIWWCSLGLNIGSEVNGKNKNFERPVLILKKYGKYTALAIPETTRPKKGDFYHAYTHNQKRYYLLLTQARLISTKRLLRKIRTLDKENFYHTKLKYCRLVLSEK